MTFVGWEVAWHEALYGTDGFYRRPGGPAAHFRTSVHASPQFADALLRLVQRAGLRRVVDVGSGRGELLKSLQRSALAQGVTVELLGCDVVDRPTDLPPQIGWVRSDGGTHVPKALRPMACDALVVAHEWLDDVPCTVAERGDDGTWRRVDVDPSTGHERLGGPLEARERDWLDRWWPSTDPQAGDRAEVGTTRDEAWASLVRCAPRSLLVAVDYGHDQAGRPVAGSLTGYRDGSVCPALPDGSCDVTAHVAVDAVAVAGEAAGALASLLTTQREALHALGVDGTPPPPASAAADPVGYLHRLSAASHAAELTDRTGLGAFRWLMQSTRRDGREPRELLDGA